MLKEFIQKLDILTNRQKTILIRFDFNLDSLEDIGDEVKLSPAMIVSIAKKARTKVGLALMERFRLLDQNQKQDVEIRLLKYKLIQAEKALTEQGKPIPKVTEIDATPLEDYYVSTRLYNTLKMHRVNVIGDIKNVGNECMQWRNFSKKTYAELREFMHDLGITWPVNEPQLH